MMGSAQSSQPFVVDGVHRPILGNQLSVISTVAERMAASCAMAATVTPSSISTSSANAPDRRGGNLQVFMEPVFKNGATTTNRKVCSADMNPTPFFLTSDTVWQTKVPMAVQNYA